MTVEPVMSYAEAAGILADELDNERLTVELMPAPRPLHATHMVRVVTGRNPLWYRRLALCVSPRHRRYGRCTTGIRRGHVMQALRRLARGVPRGTFWEDLVMPVVIATAHDARASA